MHPEFRNYDFLFCNDREGGIGNADSFLLQQKKKRLTTYFENDIIIQNKYFA